MRIPFALALFGCTLPAAAQDFLGFAYNTEVCAASRGAIGLNAGETMTRLDSSEHAGWGTGTAGYRTVHSIACVIQDLNAATAEYFDIKLYPESATSPGFPDLTQGVVFATGVPGPTGSGGAAVLRVVTPGAPVAVPILGGGDVFVSLLLPVASATDGLSPQVVLGYSLAGFPKFDVPSTLQGGSPPPAATPANSHFLSRIGSTLAYAPRRQLWLDVEHGGAGGVGLAITNQTSFPTSNTPSPSGWGPAPGTGDFESGSFPDVAGTNSGRGDDLAMQFFKTGFGNGKYVAFLRDQDFSPSWGAELPVANFFAGASGSLCLVNPEIIGFATTTNHEAFLVTTIPPAIRLLVSGLTVKQQAVGIDAAGVFHASACDAMRL